MTPIWTTDKIYKDANCGYTTTPSSDWLRANAHLVTDEFRAAVRSERSMVVAALQTVPEAAQRVVGLHKLKCPVCDGTGTAHQEIRGRSTGIVLTRSAICTCRALHSFWPKWDLVDRRWKDVHLANLAPSTESVSSFSEQQENIAHIKTKPTGNFLLAGAGNAGKTYLMYTIYRHRLEEWAAHPNAANGQSVWMYSATEYLNAVSRNAQDPTNRAPDLTPDLIRKRSHQGLPVAIFLDEVDKIDPTKSRMSTLFELIRTASACMAQVVMTSNKSAQALSDKLGADLGIHLLRRVGAPPDGYTLTFNVAPKAGH